MLLSFHSIAQDHFHNFIMLQASSLWPQNNSSIACPETGKSIKSISYHAEVLTSNRSVPGLRTEQQHYCRASTGMQSILSALNFCPDSLSAFPIQETLLSISVYLPATKIMCILGWKMECFVQEISSNHYTCSADKCLEYAYLLEHSNLSCFS